MAKKITLTRRQACAAYDALRFLIENAGVAEYMGDHDKATADYAASVAASLERQIDQVYEPADAV